MQCGCTSASRERGYTTTVASFAWKFGSANCFVVGSRSGGIHDWMGSARVPAEAACPRICHALHERNYDPTHCVVIATRCGWCRSPPHHSNNPRAGKRCCVCVCVFVGKGKDSVVVWFHKLDCTIQRGLRKRQGTKTRVCHQRTTNVLSFPCSGSHLVELYTSHTRTPRDDVRASDEPKLATTLPAKRTTTRTASGYVEQRR